MTHHCHAPGCTVAVPPKMHMCRAHWFELPKRLRDKIWATYVPGQEIRKDPSAAYLAVMEETTAYVAAKAAAKKQASTATFPFLESASK